MTQPSGRSGLYDLGRLPAGRAGGLGALYAIAIAFSAFQLCDRRLQPAAEPDRARRCMSASCCCSTFGPDRQRGASGRAPVAIRSTGRSAIARLRGRSLSLGVLCRTLIPRAGDPDAPPTSSSACSPSALVFEARAAPDGRVPADHLRRLSRLRAVRPVSARRRSNHRGYDFDQVVDQIFLGTEGIYGIADLRLRDLHLPVHPVRLVPRAGRDDPALHRRLARPGRPQPRWAGQGRGDLVRPDGHDHRLAASPTSSPPASSPSR